MPPKRKRKAAAAPAAATTAKATSNVTSEPTEHLDEKLPVLYIDHCMGCHTFRRRALQTHEELLQGLRSLKKDLQLQLQLNADGKPKSGSFEISISEQPASAEKRKLLWSGVKKTPRANKWPNMEKLLQEISAALKLTDAKTALDEQQATSEAEEEPKPKIARTRKQK